MPAKSIPSKKSKKVASVREAKNRKSKSITPQIAPDMQRYLEPAFTSQLMEHVQKAKQKAITQRSTRPRG